MNDKLDRILVFSYYHPFIAGGGHRPHQILLEDLRRGRDVVFIFSSPTKLEDMESLDTKGIYRRLAAFYFGSGGELVPVTPFASCLLGGQASVQKLIKDWRPVYARAHNPVDVFCPAIEELRAEGIPFIYDQMDYWPAFAVQPWGTTDVEARYIQLSNAVTTISNYLVERAPKGTNFHLIANAISPSFLAAIAEEKEKRRREQNGTKHVLYMGAIWPQWFDWDLIFYLVEHCRDYQFTMIGATTAYSDEDDGRSTGGLAKHLTRYSNVKLVNEIPHRQLVSWLNQADIGLIPFVVNEVTLACSPLKVFEYIGAGLSVVSTALPEIKDYPQVSINEDYGAFLESLIRSDRGDADDAKRQAAEEFIRMNTWQSRTHDLDQIAGALL